ncbi:ABC transporter ATP-binding protein, partial [Bacillus thuringiensis]
MIALETKDVTKKYKKKIAVNEVTISLEENKIYGLLGRNGAGKTTLL